MKPLSELIKESVEAVKRMTLDEQNVMLRAQAESWARAEASWPKPQFHYEGRTKVYHSIEDYYND